MELAKMNQIALETPFPQFFTGISAFIKPTSTLLPTQAKNVANIPQSLWYTPKFDRTVTMIYPDGLKEGLSIPKTLDRFAMPNPYDFSLPIDQIWIDEAKSILEVLEPQKPVCLVKFPTERRYFNLPSRNPKTEYFTRFMKQNEYSYIDITETHNDEWYADEVPDIEKLSLSLNQLMGMMKIASMNLFCPGFMIPLSIALEVPALCIFGGYVKPTLLLDDRMNLSKFKYIAPDSFCNCMNATHDCNKEIDARHISRLQTA
jgi:hypothetical protein